MQAKAEVTNLIQPILDVARKTSDEIEDLLENGLRSYLFSQTSKYYKINTFLHRYEKIKLSDVYFLLRAKYLELVTDFKDINNIFKNYSHINIVGNAGSGKTMLSKYLYVSLLKDKKLIPLYIELRKLNISEDSFEDYIVRQIIKSKIKPSIKIFQRALMAGKFVFILDGYDEVVSTRKQKLCDEIENFIDCYPNNPFIITTRPGGGSERLPRFYDFEMLDLESEEIQLFVKKMVVSKERSSQILELIGTPDNNEFFHYLKRPLLLSMYILSVESHPEIPAQVSSFYWNVFDTLYSRHDGITKNSFPREKKSGLTKDDFVSVLQLFSYTTYFEEKYRFTYEEIEALLISIKNILGLQFDPESVIYDLNTTISILLKDGLEYEFPHRSMQEFFTARFIKSLDTNDKEQVFTQYRHQKKFVMNNEVQHFWKLISELDRLNFLKYFVVPELDCFLTSIDHKSSENKLRTFYDHIPMIIAIYSNEEDEQSDMEQPLTIGVLPNKYVHLLNFIEVENKFPFPESKEQAISILGKVNAKTNATMEAGRIPLFRELLDNGIMDYVIELSFDRKVDLIIASVEKKVGLLKSEIRDKSSKMTSFISINKDAAANNG